MNYPANLDFNSRRSPVVGQNGMVATSQPLAVAAGLQILEQGGNAADAAIATAAALNVTEPTSTGLGGDCFALFYKAETKTVHALNGSGRSPHALTFKLAHEAGFTESLPNFHPYTITVPGAAAGWADLVSRFGRLSLNDVLVPAIQLAEGGFPVAPITAYFWDSGAQRQLKQAPNGIRTHHRWPGSKTWRIFQKSVAWHVPSAFWLTVAQMPFTRERSPNRSSK